MLDSTLDYEVALVNFLHPKNYYTILANDEDFAIHLVYTCDIEPHILRQNVVKYVPKFSMVGQMRGVQTLLDLINDDIIAQTEEILGKDAIKKYIPNGRLLAYDWDADRCHVETSFYGGRGSEGEISRDRCRPDMGVYFSHRISGMLGFEENKIYRFYVSHPPSVREKLNLYNNNIAARSPRTDGDVDFLYIYSDIVTPCRFAGQQVNMLDAFAWQGTSAKGCTPPLYKQLLSKSINSVGVRITDQNGYPLVFDENQSVTLILHIRPR